MFPKNALINNANNFCYVGKLKAGLEVAKIKITPYRPEDKA